MADQNDGGGAADESFPRFDHYFGYNEYVSVYFKTQPGDFYTDWRGKPTTTVLDKSSSFQTYRKPSGLNIFVEKTCGRNWVHHEFIYER